MFLQMERDKYFSSLIYSICEGLYYFFSSKAQRKMCMMVRKKLYLSLLFKKGNLRMTLQLKLRMAKFSLLS